MKRYFINAEINNGIKSKSFWGMINTNLSNGSFLIDEVKKELGRITGEEIDREDIVVNWLSEIR